MRILTVHNFYHQPGGEDVVWRSEAALLRSKGHEVTEFVRRNDEIINRGILASASLAIRTIWSRETVRELSRVLAQERPQLVHFHNTFPLISASAYYPCRESGVPVVQTLHNYRLACPAAIFFRQGHICEECLDHSLWRAVRHSCYRGSRCASAATASMLAVHRLLNTWRDMVDCFVVPAEFCRAKLSHAGIPPRKIVVKPNFLESDPGCRQGAGDYALFVGRLAPEKGIATLLSAWKRLSSKVPLRVYGDGSLRSDVERAATADGAGLIQFYGWADRRAVIDAIKGARFLVFPSEWYETFGLSVIEAFACGVPVIASRLGAVAELVSDHCTGLHFAPGDSADLAAKAQWAYEHPRELEQMGRNARFEYESKYTGESNYNSLMKIYSQVIADKVGCSARDFAGLASPMRRQA
jgi:glycosyltransferase involved in cell wall biosynthesis